MFYLFNILSPDFSLECVRMFKLALFEMLNYSSLPILFISALHWMVDSSALMKSKHDESPLKS